MDNKIKNILLSPITIAFCMIVGLVIGYKSQEITNFILPIGQIYVQSMQMCIIPIIGGSIINSIIYLMHHRKKTFNILKKYIFFALCILIIVSITTLLISKLNLSANHFDQSLINKLNKNISPHDSSTAKTILDTAHKKDFWGFFKQIVPTNIFTALAEDQILSVLLVWVLLGIAFGTLPKNKTYITINFLDAMKAGFMVILSWILYFLPIGTICVFASIPAHLGIEFLSIFLKFYLVFILIAISIIIILSIILFAVFGKPAWDIIKQIKDPFFIGIATSSSIVAMPVLINNLSKIKTLDKEAINLLIPVGINFLQAGGLLITISSSVFIAEIIGIKLDLSQLGMILAISFPGAILIAGVPAIAAVSVLGIILQNIGYPANITLSIMMAIIPIADIIATGVNIATNGVITAIATKKS